ncbi:MAG: S41 family peptidase [Lachnospiraceae bacterium]|nr:S41 family peptidase [Lachnospiraceae bacterium]
MDNQKSNRLIIIVLTVFMTVLILIAAGSLILLGKNGSYQNRDSGEIVSDSLKSKLESIRSMIDRYYLFDESEADFETAMIRAYVDELGDPYTVYYTKEEFAEMMESNSGVYSGIGAVLQQDPETMELKIVRPFKNSPAELAGLKADDIVKKVDDHVLDGEDINLVVTWIRGEKGSRVEMTVYRPSENRTFTVTVTRDNIEEESVEYKMLPDDIGYILITGFNDVTPSQFMNAFNDLKAEGMKALIMDLRDNGGGLLSATNAMVGHLIDPGIITYTIDKNNNREDYTSKTPSELNVPSVVLVNEYTASASEIFTGALQSYHKATVVGTQTFGKGIVQTLQMLPDGSGLKITFSRYYTPSGVCIHETGLTPDVLSENDPETEEDDQLECAIGELKKQLNGK